MVRLVLEKTRRGEQNSKWCVWLPKGWTRAAQVKVLMCPFQEGKRGVLGNRASEMATARDSAVVSQTRGAGSGIHLARTADDRLAVTPQTAIALVVDGSVI